VAHLTPAHTVNEQDASQYDGMSVAWHRKARRHGRGSAYLRIGRTIRYRIGDLDAWLAKHRVEPRESRAS
jgi:hypothetical protein